MGAASNNNWTQYYKALPGDDEGNRNMTSFPEFCSNTSADEISKLRELVVDPITIFLGASNGKVLILRSPTNFGGTRTRKTNEVACLAGMGTGVTGILSNVESILSPKRIKGAEKDDVFK